MRKEKEIKIFNDDPEILYNCVHKKLKQNIYSMSKKDLFRIIHILSESDLSKALQIINIVGDEYNDISYIFLKIKIFSMSNEIERAINTLNIIDENIISKRAYMPIIDAIAKNDKQEAFDFLCKNLNEKFRLFENDIKCFFNSVNESNINRFINLIEKNNIILKNYNSINFIKDKSTLVELNEINECPNCNSKIKKIPLSKKDTNKLIDNINSTYLKDYDIGKTKNFYKLEALINKNKYDAFIDGNNVIHYIDRRVSINGFYRLKSIFDKLSSKKKPLIFIHKRHKKFINNNLNELKNLVNSLNIYYTPYCMDDDWFFIWAGLKNKNSIVVTNDLLRDHINKISEDDLISNTLDKWISEYIVKYDFTNNKFAVKLYYPNDITIKTQQNKTHYHIPVCDNKWFCFCK